MRVGDHRAISAAPHDPVLAAGIGPVKSRFFSAALWRHQATAEIVIIVPPIMGVG
jgi:hypothetical protein